MFRSAGPVSETRLVFDKDTGKSKGFAFVEYYDAESAASAVRNLDNYPVGHMRLKVDISGEDAAENNAQPTIKEIANIIAGLPLQNKQQFVSDFRTFSIQNRTQCFEYLSMNPQIGYALVQTMLDIGKLDQKQADTLLPECVVEKPKSRSKPKQKQASASANSASKNNAASQSAGQQSLASVQTQVEEIVDDERREMIRQVMSVSDDQLDLLDPEQRNAVLEIRSKVQTGEIKF